MGELIAVLSGKGGTGKTSVCAGVAAALAAEGKRVLCIDCDVGLRNLDIPLGLTDSGALSFLDICEGGYSLDQAAVHPTYPTLSFLTAPVTRPVEDINPEPFGEMLRLARHRFQYIFLDAPAGVDAGFRLAARFADRIILVTGADLAAMRDAARAGDLLEAMGKTNIRLVVNRVNKKLFGAMSLTIDDVMDSTGLPLLGIVPEDHRIVLSAVFGQTLAQYSKKSPAVSSYRRIAKRIQGLPAPISVR